MNTALVVGSVILLVVLCAFAIYDHSPERVAARDNAVLRHHAPLPDDDDDFDEVEPVALVVETNEVGGATVTREYTASGGVIRETTVTRQAAFEPSSLTYFKGSGFVSLTGPREPMKYFVEDDDGIWRGFEAEADADYFRDVVLPRIRAAKRAGLPPPSSRTLDLPEPAPPPVKRDFPELDFDE